MTKGKVASLIVGILLAVPATTAFAQNDGFEAGLGNWTTIGDVSTTTTFTEGVVSINAIEGANMARVNTQGSFTDAQVEDFLDLSTGKLDSLGLGNATTGSALKRNLMVQAGDQVVFSYNFYTRENLLTQNFIDFGFFSVTQSDTANVVVAVNSLTTNPSGWLDYSYTFTAAGTFTIGIGAFNVADNIGQSDLFVDNFRVVSGNGGVNPVPEPGEVTTALFLGATLLGGIVIGRRRRQNAA